MREKLSHHAYKPSLRFVLRLRLQKGGGAYLWDTTVNELRCYRAKTEGSEKVAVARSRTSVGFDSRQLPAFYFHLITSEVHLFSTYRGL